MCKLELFIIHNSFNLHFYISYNFGIAPYIPHNLQSNTYYNSHCMSRRNFQNKKTSNRHTLPHIVPNRKKHTLLYIYFGNYLGNQLELTIFQFLYNLQNTMMHTLLSKSLHTQHYIVYHNSSCMPFHNLLRNNYHTFSCNTPDIHLCTLHSICLSIPPYTYTYPHMNLQVWKYLSSDVLQR